jgi:hypothetical protein
MTDDFTDLGHLPKAKHATEGEPPDEHPRWGAILIDWCHAQAAKRNEEWEATHPEPDRFFHSNAGKCAREIAYSALRIPKSNPTDPPGSYIMWLGSMIHEAWQSALQEQFPDATVEVSVKADDMGGRIDAVVKLETGQTRPYVVAIEAKSQGGFGYKLSSAKFQGPPEGPKLGHKLQAFLNAKRIDADEAVIVYFAKDPNNWVADGLDPYLRVTATWTYTREQYMPLADKEDRRIQGILALLDEGQMLPARRAPELGDQAHLILDPLKGDWANVVDGQMVYPEKYKPFWGCGYCDYRDVCAQTGAGREPVSVLVDLGVLSGEAGDVAKVGKDSQPVVETDDEGKRHVKVVDETGEHEVLEGDPQDVQRVVVDIDRELNREDQQP